MWEEGSASIAGVLETQVNQLPWLQVVDLAKEGSVVGDLECVTPPPVAGESSQGTIEGEGSLLFCDLPCITICKKHGVSGKPNAWKSSLTNTMYLANAMSDFAIGFAHVEEHKIAFV